MITVCDASPLIFLCKVDCLQLVADLLDGVLLIPDDVERELFEGSVEPAEAETLRYFLKERCRIVRIRPSGFRASALSRPDRTVLTLAKREGGDRVLSDDRLLRDLSEVEGCKPIGTLGLLLAALRKRLMTKKETRSALHELIRKHGFRISIELYEAVLTEIEKAR